MSHGPSVEGGVRPDPNLTPLLDVVLQLLMFFMMCMNFIGHQVNLTIQLPRSQTASPIQPPTREKGKEKEGEDMLVLNVSAEGEVLVLGQRPRTVAQMEQWLKDQYHKTAVYNEENGLGEVRTAVVIRAHRDVPYSVIWELFRYCSQAKYADYRLRTVSGS
jgi:biopolymer transport protein ExbD